MRDPLLMHVVEAAEQLSEVEAAGLLAERATQCDVVEQLTALRQLQRDAHHRVLRPIVLLHLRVLAVLVHVHDVRVRQLRHRLYLCHKEIQEVGIDSGVLLLEDLNCTSIAGVEVHTELDLGVRTCSQSALQLIPSNL